MIYDELALNNGVIFQHAFDILNSRTQLAIVKRTAGEDTPNDKVDLELALFVPAVVNGAFACELFMKAMLPKNTRGHKLQELFNDLDTNIQDRIKNNTLVRIKKFSESYTDVDFYTDLTHNGNIFSEWRYFHEGNVNSANFRFISNFMKAVFDIALEERSK